MGAARAPSPWGSAAGEEAALPLRALGRQRVPPAVPLTNLYFLFQTKTNPASRLRCVQTSPLRDAFKTRDSPTPSGEVKFGGNEVRWCGGAATKRNKRRPPFSESRFGGLGGALKVAPKNVALPSSPSPFGAREVLVVAAVGRWLCPSAAAGAGGSRWVQGDLGGDLSEDLSRDLGGDLGGDRSPPGQGGFALCG